MKFIPNTRTVTHNDMRFLFPSRARRNQVGPDVDVDSWVT